MPLSQIRITDKQKVTSPSTYRVSAHHRKYPKSSSPARSRSRAASSSPARGALPPSPVQLSQPIAEKEDSEDDIVAELIVTAGEYWWAPILIDVEPPLSRKKLHKPPVFKRRQMSMIRIPLPIIVD
jgi:hypothetical protein